MSDIDETNEEVNLERRLSTNPFLYEDGSLVEDDVLKTLEKQYSEEKESDSEHTPKAEAPPNTLWSPHKRAISLELEEEKTMTGSYSEILERPLFRDNSIPEEKNVTAEEIPTRPLEELKISNVEEADAETPVCEDIDPVQLFLSQERLSAFIARSEDQPSGSHYSSKLMNLSSCQATVYSPEVAEDLLRSGGQVNREGDLISFVTDNLQHKIMLASPGSKEGSLPGTRSSTPNMMKRQHSSVPPIDPSLILDLETCARHIATNIDNLIENLTDTLYNISSLTVDCVETYRDAVCKTCDAVDSNIKSMYQLMAKCEELGKSMKPIYKLQDQIKEVKRLLDMFEKGLVTGGN